MHAFTLRAGGVFMQKQGLFSDDNLLQMTSKTLLYTVERAGLTWGCGFRVTTRAVRAPAPSHMDPCLLLAAIPLEINAASIKAIKVNKVHWMKFPLAALAKHHLVVFSRMQRTWIHRWKSIRSELLVLLMNESSPGVGRGGELVGELDGLWTSYSRTAVKWWNAWKIPTCRHYWNTRYIMYSSVLCRYSAEDTGRLN